MHTTELNEATAHIEEEVRGNVMQYRIDQYADMLFADFQQEIDDAMGELLGKLTTDLMHDDEETADALASHAFDSIHRTLMAELRKRLA